MIGFAALLLAIAQPPAPFYVCNEVFPNFDGPQSLLTLTKSFRAESPSFGVYVEGPSIVRPEPSLPAAIKLRWPESGSFSWANGSIEISWVGHVIDSVVRPDDVARRIVVGRGNWPSTLFNSQHAAQEIYLSPVDQNLVSQLTGPTVPPTLRMRLDTLLAWGTGQSSLTVYETMISAPQGRNPIGRERVMRRYEIDLVALTRLLTTVRERADRWRAGLVSNDPSRCRLEQPLGVIVN